MNRSLREFGCHWFAYPKALHFVAAVASLCPVSSYAADHEIRTRGSQWAPIVLFIEPGDSVTWVGMSGHETELIEGMGPENAMLWRSELDEEGFRVTFVMPGAYVYKCHVHLRAGMIGAIVVGDGVPENLDEIDAALETLGQGRSAARRVVAQMKREIGAR